MKTLAISLAVIISLGVAVIPAGHAQGPESFAPQQVQHVTVQPGTRVILDAPANETGSGHGCVGNWLCRHLGSRCFGHHDEPRTGNICSESVFLFGSSRAYFGEPCRPIPPGYYGCGQGRYGIAPYADCNCAHSKCANGSCGK